MLACVDADVIPMSDDVCMCHVSAYVYFKTCPAWIMESIPQQATC